MSQNSSSEVSLLAQIKRNEVKLQQMAQLDREDEYELQLKMQHLADLKEQTAHKSEELRKVLEIGQGLAKMEAAARHTAESNLRLSTAHEALLLQNRSQHAQLLSYHSTQRAAIIRQHHEAYDRLRRSIEARPDVAALSAQRQQAADSSAAIAASTLRLQQLRTATIEQRSQSQQQRQAQLVRLAGLAVRRRDLDAKRGALQRMHRTQCERVAMRAKLLQCQSRRCAELQARLAKLKHDQATTFFENIETVSPLGLELDVSGGSPAGGKSPQLQAVAVAVVAKKTIAAPAASVERRASQASIAAVEICADLDQMRISGGQAGGMAADQRRVHFNPTDSVRPIAAIGDRSEEEEEEQIEEAEVEADSEADVGCSAPVFSPVARDTETEPMDGMHSNDSFMCALAGDDRLLRDEVEERADGEEEVAAVGEDGRTTTIPKAGEESGENVDRMDDFLNDTLTLIEPDEGERFDEFFPAKASAADDDQSMVVAGDMRSPPAKRAKLRQRSVSSLNTSIRSVAAMSDFEFDFDAFGGDGDGDEMAGDVSFNEAGTEDGVDNDDGRAGGDLGQVSRANSDFFEFDLGGNFGRSTEDLF